MKIFTGWLLDLFENPGSGVCMWMMGEDGTRQRFIQAFEVTFYIAGSAEQIDAIKRWLTQENSEALFEIQNRYDLFKKQNRPVLAVKMQNAYIQQILFRKMSKIFPDVEYFDADVAITLRHAAAFKTFPLAYCRLTLADGNQVKKIEVLEQPWDIKYPGDINHPRPHLRILFLEPDRNPQDAEPEQLLVSYQNYKGCFSLKSMRALLINLSSILDTYDPDIIQTRWGDTWLLPALTKASDKLRIVVRWNREPGRGVAHRSERTYFSYGQIVYRGEQSLLFGRIHIDTANAMLWNDYELDGVLELARVTRLPIQQTARQSSGTGISSMQIVKALENKILVPYQKQQTEEYKSAQELLQLDQGGLVYQPLIGVYDHVGEIDFISMYPNIMVRCNISPETNPTYSLEPADEPPGLIPQTLAPLLKKRMELKERLGKLPSWVPAYKMYQHQASAEKWLLVTCFGYLGYKNARFGRIEAHEAITANGREAILRAKEAAENLGFLLLHMYVDGLWVQKNGANHAEAFQDLLNAIAKNTGLSVSLNGIYRWVAFLPSRADSSVPVPNRYFGVFQDGSLKMRGIEARRHDTPPFVSSVQLEILEYLAQAENIEILMEKFIPGALVILRNRLADLYRGHYALKELAVTHRISREPGGYKVQSASARAFNQIISAGKSLRPGQRIRFLYTRDDAGVFACGLFEEVDKRRIDHARYRELILKAAETILTPFGWNLQMLDDATGKIPAIQQQFFPQKRKIYSPSSYSYQPEGENG